jgi:hypothetical protein
LRRGNYCFFICKVVFIGTKKKLEFHPLTLDLLKIKFHNLF